MNNTALRAESQSATSHKASVTYGAHPYDITHMVFKDDKHEKFYYEKLGQVRYQGWQTSGSVRVVRLAFNLYTDGTPGVDEYKRKDEQVRECKAFQRNALEYSVSDIFCCGYARYFWEGIKLRYPEYCGRQKYLDEILAEMGRERNAENSIDGNEKRHQVV